MNIIERKKTECILCGFKEELELKESKPFLYINKNNINEKRIFNILLNNYKEKYSYVCQCRKNEKEDILCSKIKYYVNSYPEFLFVLFGFN